MTSGQTDARFADAGLSTTSADAGLTDASIAHDPTGTAGIRRSFRAHGELRLRRLRALTRQIIVDYDILGLGGGVDGAGAPIMAPSQRLETFTRWFEAEARNALAGPWFGEWINRAAKSGEVAAAHEISPAGGDVWLAPGHLIDQLHALAEHELRGIAAVLTQQVARIALASAAGRKGRAAQAFRAIVVPLDKIGPVRMNALANTMTVKAHNVAKLITYRANGLEQVGVTPELHVSGNAVTRANLVEPLTDAYDPDEPRDAGGRWGSGGATPETAKLEKHNGVHRVRPAGFDFGFVTPKGALLQIGGANQHDRAAHNAGTTIDRLMAEGTIRANAGGFSVGTLHAQTNKRPTDQQILALSALARAHELTSFVLATSGDPERFSDVTGDLTSAVIATQVEAVFPTTSDGYDPDEPRDAGGRWGVGGTVKRIEDHTYRAYAKSGRIAGQLTINPYSKPKEVFEIVTNPQFQRQGVATAMMQAAEKDHGEIGPSTTLSEEGFRFFQKFRPEAVAADLRNHAAQLMGQGVTGSGGAGTIVSVGRAVATANYTGKSGTNSQFPVPRAEIKRLLRSADSHAAVAKRAHTSDADEDDIDPDDAEDIDSAVGVRTAGDDLVCQECQDIADDAPYSIDDALDLIPAHPNCRCAFFPWWDRRFSHEAEGDA